MSSGDVNMFCLPREMVEEDFREPFITIGYRKPGMNFVNCLKSIFMPYCNESVNVWSHGIFGLYFCVKFYKVFTNEFNVMDIFIWPLLAYSAGTIGFCFMSAAAHTFNSMSAYWRHKCFYLDYAAISTYCFGYCQAFYFYCCPVDTTAMLQNSPKTFLLTSLIISMLCTYLNSIAVSIWPRYQFIIRTMVYASPFIIAASPLMHRLLFCTTEVDCDFRAFPLYLKECAFIVLATFAYVSKLPERYARKRFDCLGQSHHLFHILISIAADKKFEFLKAELLNRRESIEHQVEQLALYSLPMMASAFALNVVICCFVNPSGRDRVNKAKQE